MTSYAINTTGHDIPQQFKEPQASMLIRHSLFVIFTVASVVGNSIVIRSIIMIPTKRLLTYVFVSNLALAELFNSILLPAIQVYDELNTWPFGAFLCHVISPLQIVMVMSITWTIVIISYLRYRALVCRERAAEWKSLHKVIMLACIWGFAFGFAVPAFIYTVFTTSPYDDRRHWCLILFDGDSIASYPAFNKFSLVRFVVNFCLPVVLMIWFYGRLAVVLKYYRISRVGPLRLTTRSTAINFQSSNDNHLDVITEVSTSQPSTSSSRTRIYIQEEVLLGMMYTVVVIFIVFYFPYQLLFILEHYQVVTIHVWYYHHITRRYLFLLTCLPSALHPLCYGTVSQYYAKILSCIFFCKYVKRTRS